MKMVLIFTLFGNCYKAILETTCENGWVGIAREKILIGLEAAAQPSRTLAVKRCRYLRLCLIGCLLPCYPAYARGSNAWRLGEWFAADDNWSTRLNGTLCFLYSSAQDYTAVR